MKFRTEVTIEPTALRLTPASHVLLLGSCFAEEVGTRLADSLPEGHVVVNPCGVLYNPESIAQTLRLLLMGESSRRAEVGHSLFEARDGRWHSWLYSTKFTGATRTECREVCLAALGKGLEGVDVLVITLGSDHCYRLRADGRVVANCHKEPATLFDEGVMPRSTALSSALGELRSRYPSLQVILTVSPYRYAKYGLHESQLIKSRLLLQVDTLCHDIEGITYFPAYEIVLDELRDYRFYAADMLHPSDQAADYIFERFSEWCFAPELVAFAAQRIKELKRERHRTIEATCSSR